MLTRSCSVSIQWEFQAVCISAKIFLVSSINSSLSFINEQIFRLLLKISVYERHQLRVQTIFLASSEEAINCGGKHHQTPPNETSNQNVVAVCDVLRCSGPHIYSGRAQKWETLLKSSIANSTQCSQAVTHPSTN